MRRVKFYIDDLAFFKKEYKFTDEQMTEVFGKDRESFKVIYTLYGKFKEPDRYELTDYDGNKVCRESLNNYQRGVVLNDCFAYYVGGKYHFNCSYPCGVVKIIDEEI